MPFHDAQTPEDVPGYTYDEPTCDECERVLDAPPERVGRMLVCSRCAQLIHQEAGRVATD